MLGINSGRINALKAENRRLRAELLAQTQRTDALSRIIVTLQQQNEDTARRLVNLAAAAQHATQQAQAGRGYCIGESVLDRICRN